MGSSSVRKRKHQAKKKTTKEKMANATETEEELVQPRKFKIRVCIITGVITVALLVAAVAAIPLWMRLAEKDLTGSMSTATDESGQDPLSPEMEIATKMGSFELLETVPHDPKAFTQGFVTVEDERGIRRIYEGTGMWGESDLRLLHLSGEVLSKHDIPSKYFGEGIAHYPLRSGDGYGIIQLTWKAKTAFDYVVPFSGELSTPPPSSNFTYSTTRNEGWGITFDPVDNLFFVSDGSAYLHVWDGIDRKEIRKVQVKYRLPHKATPQVLSRLNELEWDPVTRTILSNVWGQDVIVRIDPETGFVRVIYDCTALFQNRPASADVFNGIALTYDLLRETTDDKQVWVTGKYWPNTYRITLVDPVT